MESEPSMLTSQGLMQGNLLRFYEEADQAGPMVLGGLRELVSEAQNRYTSSKSTN